jgi:uncharacterized protein YukE
MPIVGITVEQARADLQKVTDAQANAKTLKNQMDSTAQDLTSTGWLGQQSQRYQNASNELMADLDTVITTLDSLAEQGKSDLNQYIAHES